MPFLRRFQWPSDQVHEPRPRFWTDLDISEHKYVIVERWRGGGGDVIAMRPALRALRRRYPDHRFVIHLPRYYHELVSDIADELYDYPDAAQSFWFCEQCEVEGLVRGLKYFHFWCPCGVHEHQTRGRPTRNRIENFCDYVNAKPEKPDLAFLLDGLPQFDLKRPVVACQLCTAQPAKDWPLGHWVRLWKRLIDRCRFLLFDDRPRTREMLIERGITVSIYNGGEPDTLSVVESRSWKLTTNLVNQCAAVLVPDSALLHVAGALEKPGVALFGPTSGKLTLKYYPSLHPLQGELKGEKLCKPPCYYSEYNNWRCAGVNGDCMRAIEPETVAARLLEILNRLR